MESKVFLDINILVDLIDAARKEHEAAKGLFSLIENRNVRGYYSESVVNTSAYLVKKVIPAQKFGRLIIRLNELIKILPCSNTIIEQACKQVKNDLEDAVLYHIALANNMDVFVTSNTKDFKRLEYSALPVMTANEFLEAI